MISFKKGVAALALPKAAYSRAALEAAALAVGETAQASLTTKGRLWAVELRARDLGALERASMTFLDEALAHEARRAAAKEGRPFADAAAARALERGFAAVPEDPLEQLEPQVAEDRRAEIARLLEQAG